MIDKRDYFELLSRLKAKGVIQSEEVEDAMKQVDRSHYCDRDPYEDRPQRNRCRTTISAPHMHAYALEHLRDRLVNGTKALDVGSGSGYLTACMAIMMGEKGTVVGIDVVRDLIEDSKQNVKQENGDLLTSGRVKFVVGDGRQGYAEEGPYDAIHVGAASPTVPEELIKQLKPGGRLVMPVGPPDGPQKFIALDKHENGKDLTKEELLSVRYMSLTDPEPEFPF